MARTINDIQQSMISKLQEATELSALEILTTDEQVATDANSISKVAIWRLLLYVVGFCVWSFEKLMDIFRTEIETTVTNNRPHTSSWYKSKALAFQYGDELVDSDEYAIIDADKQIIKQVAIVEGDRKLTIKVATKQGDELVKLPDEDMVNAFMSYMHKVKDAGTLLEVVNEDADKLKVELDFYYDALLVKSDGTLIDNPSLNIVQTSINNYLNSLDFNGEFEINRMIDYLQQAIGYKSLKLNYTGFKAGLATSFTPIDRAYSPLSGYMKLDELQVNYYAVV